MWFSRKRYSLQWCWRFGQELEKVRIIEYRHASVWELMYWTWHRWWTHHIRWRVPLKIRWLHILVSDFYDPPCYTTVFVIRKDATLVLYFGRDLLWKWVKDLPRMFKREPRTYPDYSRNYQIDYGPMSYSYPTGFDNWHWKVQNAFKRVEAWSRHGKYV